MPRTLPDLLREAVLRGIITAEQGAALGGLADEQAVAPSGESPRGFNWVTIAYALGGLLVVFACGWFLAERWLALGPAGVLGVVVTYAAIAAAAAVRFDRIGYPEAAGAASLIAIALTPVAAWSLTSLSGIWPVETWGEPYYLAYRPAEASRWLVAELATILAALFVLRRRRYAAVMFPVAVALMGLVIHLSQAVGLSAPILERWTMLTGALLLCAIADTVDRRIDRALGDLAFPLWTTGLVAVSASMFAFWPSGSWRHAIPLLCLGAIAAAIVMRRKTHLVFGVGWIALYLFYLSADVFRDTPYFPLVLAALGGLLLFATVWLQRHFPALAQRLGAGQARRGGLPGAAWIPWLLAAGALGITLLAIPEAREEARDREFQQRLSILRGHSRSRDVPSRRNPAQAPTPMPPPPR